MSSATRKYFVVRLLPPRPSFPFDMTDDERGIMQQHVAYWTERLREGMAVAFGPGADPNGAWGLGVVECDAAEQIEALEANDPAIKAGIGFRYEVLPMPQAVVRPR